jgi:hypothetical protein
MRSNSAAEQCSLRASEWVAEYPLTSMWVLFGVGVAVGVCLAQSAGESLTRPWRREESSLEHLAGQVRDVVLKSLPETLKRHLA